MQLSETVVATSVGFGEDSEWALIVVGHDDDTMCSFVNQTEGFTHCVCRGKSNGRLINRVTGLHEIDNRLNDVERYILRKNYEPTASRHSFGHSASSDGSHVGDNEWNGRADVVGRRQINIEA